MYNTSERFIAQYLEQKAIAFRTLPNGAIETTYDCLVIDNYGVRCRIHEYVIDHPGISISGAYVPIERRVRW